MICPACHSPRCVKMGRLTDRLFRATLDSYQLCQCRACNIQFLFPADSIKDVKSLYPESYWMRPESSHRTLPERLIAAYRRAALYSHVRFTKKIVKNQKRRNIPLRLLDVGCGDGLFLSEVGLKPSVGLDVSNQALRLARMRQLNVVRGSLHCNPFADHSFSLITMHHVLEHLSSATTYLNAARRILIRNGDLVVQVPNVDSCQARLFKLRWSGYDAPRHLIHYAPSTLCRTLVKCGFKVVGQTQFSLRDNAPMFAMSIAPKWYPPARLHRSPNTRGTFSDFAFLGISLAALPFTLAECCLGHGATTMIHAKPT